MTKQIFTCALILLSVKAIGQSSLNTFVPPNATLIGEINTPGFFKYITPNDVDSSWFGSQLFKEFPLGNKTSKTITNYGVDLTQKAYFFTENLDSFKYDAIYLPLNNQAQFVILLKNIGVKSVTQQGNYQIFKNNEDSTLLYFVDNTHSLILSYSSNFDFFNDSVVMARYGITDSRYDDYDYGAVDTVTSMDDDLPPPPKVKSKKSKKSSKSKKSKNKVKHSSYIISGEAQDDYVQTDSATGDTTYYDKVITGDDAVEVTEDTTMTSYYGSEYDGDSYYNRQSKNDSIKSSLLNKWASAYANSLFAKGSYGELSAVNKAGYKAGANNEDLIYLFVDSSALVTNRNSSSLYTSRSYRGFRPYSPWYYSNPFAYLGFSVKSIYGHMNATEKDFRWKTDFIENDRFKQVYFDVANAQMNENFFKYVNSENLIAASSFKFSSEQYLNHFPDVLANIYGSYFEESDSDKVSIFKDMLSIILDEKAIAKTFTGNGLLLVNDLRQRKISYTDYDYDENYNSTPVTRTKYQMLPDFIAMFSAEDPSIYVKSLDMAVRHKYIKKNQGVYSYSFDTAAAEGVFSIYSTIKDGIVFIGSNIADIQNIQNGSFQGKISDAHKAIFKQNNFSFYGAPSKLFNRIQPNSFSSVKSYENTNLLLHNSGDFYLKNSQSKNDTFTAELILEKSDLGKNPVDYLLKIVTQLNKTFNDKENNY